MSCTIRPSEDGTYILLKVTGEINRALAMEYNLDAHGLGKEMGISYYLMDLTEARNTDTVLQSYNFAYSDMRETPGVDRSARVAVLVSPDDRSHDFVETVTRNAGQDVTLFTDRAEALAHLSKK